MAVNVMCSSVGSVRIAVPYYGEGLSDVVVQFSVRTRVGEQNHLSNYLSSRFEPFHEH